MEKLHDGLIEDSSKHSEEHAERRTLKFNPYIEAG